MLIGGDALSITRHVFATLLVTKILVYGLIIRRIHNQLGPKHFQMFWRHYMHSRFLKAAAWRLGTFFSLLMTYALLIYWAVMKQWQSPLQVKSPLFWIWCILLGSTSLRTLKQSWAEWADSLENISALRRTMQIKTVLSHVSRAASFLVLAYPLLSLQSWAAITLWSRRAILFGKATQVVEKWFDHRVHGHMQQFVLTAIGAAILETLLKLMIVSAALLLAS